MAPEQDPPRQRRSSPPPAPESPERREIHWKVRRSRKPWQRFVERFGFTLIAIGIAMVVGLLIARFA